MLGGFEEDAEMKRGRFAQAMVVVSAIAVTGCGGYPTGEGNDSRTEGKL